MLRKKWVVGYSDQGMGHGNYGVMIDGSKELIATNIPREVAEHIVKMHNEWLDSPASCTVDFFKQYDLKSHNFCTFRKTEYEQAIGWILTKAVEADDLYAKIKTKYNHDRTLVEEGYLVKHGEQEYSLSLKSITILYEYYKKQGEKI